MTLAIEQDKISDGAQSQNSVPNNPNRIALIMFIAWWHKTKIPLS